MWGCVFQGAPFSFDDYENISISFYYHEKNINHKPTHRMGHGQYLKYISQNGYGLYGWKAIVSVQVMKQCYA